MRPWGGLVWGWPSQQVFEEGTGLEVQWEVITGLFGLETYNPHLQILTGQSPDRMGCGAPENRAGTLELKL